MGSLTRAICLLLVIGGGIWGADLGFVRADDLSNEERAFRIFEEAVRLYKARNYSGAARLFEEAYELHPEPTILRNLGRAHERQGDDGGALTAYRRLLASDPTTPDRADVESRIQRLEVATAKVARDKKLSDRGRVDAEVQQAGVGPAPWVLLGLGAGGVVTGVVLGALSRSARADAISEPSHQAGEQRLRKAENLALGANISFASGGGLILGGGIWMLVGLLGKNKDKPAAPVAVVPGSNGVTVQGSF